MTKKRILILGSGVSGLSAAWELSKKKDEVDCIILEKENSSGGWMGTSLENEFLLEKGPRVFKTSRNKELLKIAEEIGFMSSVIPSPKKAEARYLCLNQKLQKMPSNPFFFLFSALTRPLLFSLLKERKVPSYNKDETIWDFAHRRFGKEVAETFFDPLILGIYAGDIRKLSIESCFPLLKKWEREKGSIIKGAFSHLKNKKKKENLPISSSLFSFEGGGRAFIEQWMSKIAFPVHLGEEAISLKREEGGWKVQTLKQVYEADEVILALPAYVSSKLLKPLFPEVSRLLESIFYEDVTSVTIGWKEEVLPFQAFGYLVPSIEKESLLGVLFDSSISDRKGETLITLMIRGILHSEEELKQISDKVKSHLCISKDPHHFSYQKMAKAIPQYYLGHKNKIENILTCLEHEAPGLFLTGNYLDGVSVNDTINRSKFLIDS